jgi:hypothetical protein
MEGAAPKAAVAFFSMAPACSRDAKFLPRLGAVASLHAVSTGFYCFFFIHFKCVKTI